MRNLPRPSMRVAPAGAGIPAASISAISPPRTTTIRFGSTRSLSMGTTPTWSNTTVPVSAASVSAVPVRGGASVPQAAVQRHRTAGASTAGSAKGCRVGMSWRPALTTSREG